MKRFLTALVTAHAAEPVRIARLPIIFQCALPDDATRDALETQIQRAVHIPLNGTLQVAEYLSPTDSADALSELWQKISAADKKATLADAIRPLAAELDADIIVCPVVHRYSQNVIQTFGWYEDILLDSHVRVELIVYDRRTDDLRDKTAWARHHNLRRTALTASLSRRNFAS